MSNIAKLYTNAQFNGAIKRAEFAEVATEDPQAIAKADMLIINTNRQTKNAPDLVRVGTSAGVRIGLALAEIFAEEESQRADPCADEVFSAEDGKKLRNKLPSLSRYD